MQPATNSSGDAMTTLRSITVHGFKSLYEVDIELTNLNVLIGANGAGKSNFIGVFTLLNSIVDSRLQMYVATSGGPDAILTNGSQNTDAIDLHVAFGSNGYHAHLVPTQADELVFEREMCWWQGRGHDRPFRVPLGSGHRETKLNEEIARRGKKSAAQYVKDSIIGWKVYHFHDTSSSAKVKGLCEIDDNERLRPDASNLAAFLMLMRDQHPDRYTQIVRVIRLVTPFFDDFNLRPSPQSKGKTKLEWRSKKNDALFNAHALSDGSIRFICLATVLLQPTLPSTILIDEPELGLHPYAINVLAGLLRMASKRTQVIVSTQSVTLVNQFGAEDILVADRGEHGTVISRPSPDEAATWLDNYSLGELWEKNIIGGRPR